MEDEKLKLALKLKDYLNEVFETDPKAMDLLFKTYAPASQRLLAHPTVQCNLTDPDQPLVSFIGILNGFIGTRPNGRGYLHAEYSHGLLQRFGVSWDVSPSQAPDDG